MPAPQKVSEYSPDKGATPEDGNDIPGDNLDGLESLGAEILRRAEESQQALEVAWDELMARWGVQGRPVGIQRLREMVKHDDTMKPADKSFSSELIAIREESYLFG